MQWLRSIFSRTVGFLNGKPDYQSTWALPEVNDAEVKRFITAEKTRLLKAAREDAKRKQVPAQADVAEKKKVRIDDGGDSTHMSGAL